MSPATPKAVSSPSFAVVCAHFYPELRPELEHQYRRFRSQFLDKGIPLLTLAIGTHYEPWRSRFPEVRLVAGDLLFQKERLWNLGATLAEQDGYNRFLCLDADLLYDGDGWDTRLERAFRKYDVIHPFEHVVHVFDDTRLERRTTLRFPLRISGRRADLWRAWVHRAYRNRLKRVLGTMYAFGFGLAFNSEFLHTVGLYEYAIVGGGDQILWNALTWLLHQPTQRAREEALELFVTAAGYPENRALQLSMSSWIEEGRSKLGSLRVGYLKGVDAVSLPMGKKRSREYRDRSQLLNDFDPGRDIRAEPEQGFAFADCAGELERRVGQFMRSRLD